MGDVSRLSLAVDVGDLIWTEAGRIAVFGPRVGTDLSALPKALSHIITGFRPDYDHFLGQGFACNTAPEGRYAASVVFVPRSKPLAHAIVALAVSVTDGPVIIDGAKTDGIESILKDARKRADVSAPLSKAHGKLFWFPAGPGFEGWASTGPQDIEGGFITTPGVFSADGIDPASRLLADTLPIKLGSTVADLGAGWGYLSARVLEREKTQTLHVVEADHAALACARQNLSDVRAQLHWEDVIRWQPAEKLDVVITNPPFHTGRAADPDLGRAFIRSAATMLKPRGQLYLVANRHLPYEAEMKRHFAQVDEIGGDNRFKVLHGSRPTRKAR